MTLRRALARAAVATVAMVVLAVGLAGPASAHDVLVSSTPAEGSTLATVPTSLTFTFDQPVQNFDPVVSLVGPDGRQYATGTPVISGNVVTGTVGTGPSGAYTAAYRVVSSDGHPVSGEVHFSMSVTGGATGVPVGGSGSAAAASAGGLSGWLWAGLAVAAVLVIAAAILLLRRPRAARPAGDKDY